MLDSMKFDRLYYTRLIHINLLENPNSYKYTKFISKSLVFDTFSYY